MQGTVLFAQYDLNHFLFSGRQLLIDGKYSQAMENFTILSRLDSTCYEAYFLRGIAKYNLGDFSGALTDFDRCIHFNPLHTLAYHYRGIAYSQLGNFDMALKDIQEAIDLRPNYYNLYLSRGITYFLSRQFDRAVLDFNRYIRRVPDDGEVYIDRGACFAFMGDTTKAMSDFNKAISLNPSEPDGYLRRSGLYAMQGLHDDALNDLNTAIKLDTTNTFAYFNRAILEYEKKKFADALKDLNRVLEDEPGNALTLYNRALILSTLGDYADALDDYDRVLNINPGNVLAYYNRAALFTQMGRYRDAQSDYTKAIELYPDFAQAYMNRSYVRNMLGQTSASKSDYLTAQKKVAEYKKLTRDSAGRAAFADTARRYDSLLALDADFAKKDFDNEMLQYREVDVRLRPMFRFILADSTSVSNSFALRYESRDMDAFAASLPLKTSFSATSKDGTTSDGLLKSIGKEKSVENLFARALFENASKRYSSAMSLYDEILKTNKSNPYVFINRSVLQAEMIGFITSIDNGVRSLSLDESNTKHMRVREKGMVQYDYSPALSDLQKAYELDPESPYIHYNLGNLYSLSSNFPEAVHHYSKSIEIAPMIAEAYFNRGLVQIFLKDKDKGCADLSTAGELGLGDAYSVIKKYCKKEGVQ